MGTRSSSEWVEDMLISSLLLYSMFLTAVTAMGELTVFCFVFEFWFSHWQQGEVSFNFVIHALAIKVFFYYWQSRVKLIRSAAGGLSECFFQGKVCFLVGIFSLRGKYCHGSELVCAWK